MTFLLEARNIFNMYLFLLAHVSIVTLAKYHKSLNHKSLKLKKHRSSSLESFSLKASEHKLNWLINPNIYDTQELCARIRSTIHINHKSLMHKHLICSCTLLSVTHNGNQ